MRTRVLSVHAGYRCHNSGACCSSGWPIPVEPEQEDALRAALLAGTLRAAAAPEALFRPAPGLPHEARVVLGANECGECLFFEREGGRLCGVHRQRGPEALPSTCRHFPRMARLEPGAVALTLSHYCPTAAELLLADTPLRVVEDPPAFPPDGTYEGLDARAGFPPLLRPGVLMDWASHAAWEEHAVALLSAEASAEEALARLAADAEALRAWTVERGPLPDFLAATLASPRPRLDPDLTFAHALALRDAVAADVPAAFRAHLPARAGRVHLPGQPGPSVLPAGPAGEDEGRRLAAADAAHVAPHWAPFAPVVRRYLAARTFASWAALQGEGLRTSVAATLTALAVLRVEAARQCADTGRALGREALQEALRAADLLLVHFAAPDALARRLSRVERRPALRRLAEVAR